MKQNILNIIPDNNQYSDDIDKVPSEERDNAHFWYLHGELEEIVGFDKGVITNCKTLGISKPFKYNEDEGWTNKLYLKGVVECQVKGINEPCVGYFYVTDDLGDYWMQRGLVCLKSDKKGRLYAELKMKEKSIIL